ncbi:MAG TPA: ribose 5-phosphate isomerase B [Clostridiaceae bacterium]|jgi:ribose 5-phosphate isomerase B|nr:ribose 5-phosphate isomerase B [Clostridiaceae bacterium]
MKIVVASDHGGYEMKEAIRRHLSEKGFEVLDAGTYSEESASYVEFSQRAADKIVDGTCDRGIVVCGTGIGVSMVANKNPGVRCALCTDSFMAEMARHHNDANMLALGGRILAIPYALMLVDLFLSEPYDGGRHDARLEQIADRERRTFCV